jgi:hypothetical protein
MSDLIVNLQSLISISSSVALFILYPPVSAVL